MIQVDKSGVIPRWAYKAFKPPKRGVETVGKMDGPLFGARLFQKVGQLSLFINAKVPVVGLIVLFGKGPANPFR